MDNQVRIFASEYPLANAESKSAVLVTYGQIILRMSIAQAREHAMALARAADEAELNLPTAIRSEPK